MKRTIFTILVLVSIIISAQDKTEKIDNLMDRYLEYGLFNGSVLVADQSGIILSKGYGYANMEWMVKADENTKYRIGSVTKQFTALIIKQLEEEGKLSTDDKLSSLLDYYREDTGDKIMVKHLLTHTSGVPNYTNRGDFFTDLAYRKFTTDEFIKNYCMDDLEFEPGEKWNYSNSGYMILGAIIEHIEKKPFGEVLQERILDKTGMDNSGFDSSSEIIKNRAAGYRKSVDEYSNSDYINMFITHAAGAMYSTIEDLYKWDRALYTEELLSEDAKEEYFTPVKNNYAYGWMIMPVKFDSMEDSISVILHGGGINGFSAIIYRDTTAQNFITILSNVQDVNLSRIAMKILEILYNGDPELPKRPVAGYLYSYYENNPEADLSDIYYRLKEEENKSFLFEEADMNMLGYKFLNQGNTEKALEIFRLNIKEFSTSSNVYDSYGEALLVKGDTTKAVENYKKSVQLNPGNEHGRTVLKKLGAETEEEVTVSPEILARYEGKYVVSPQFALKIRVEGNRIFTQATAQPEFEIFPINEKKFYLKAVNAQILFEEDDAGNVEKLTIFQNGAQIVGKKVQE